MSTQIHFHSDWVLPLAFRTLKCVGAAIWPAQLEGHPAPFRLQTWHESIMMSRLGKKNAVEGFFRGCKTNTKDGNMKKYEGIESRDRSVYIIVSILYQNMLYIWKVLRDDGTW